MYKTSYLNMVMIIVFVLIGVGIGYAGWKNLDNDRKLKNPENTSIELLTTNNQ
jgi:hypothetical protein